MPDEEDLGAVLKPETLLPASGSWNFELRDPVHYQNVQFSRSEGFFGAASTKEVVEGGWES